MDPADEETFGAGWGESNAEGLPEFFNEGNGVEEPERDDLNADTFGDSLADVPMDGLPDFFNDDDQGDSGPSSGHAAKGKEWDEEMDAFRREQQQYVRQHAAAASGDGDAALDNIAWAEMFSGTGAQSSDLAMDSIAASAAALVLDDEEAAPAVPQEEHRAAKQAMSSVPAAAVSAALQPASDGNRDGAASGASAVPPAWDDLLPRIDFSPPAPRVREGSKMSRRDVQYVARAQAFAFAAAGGGHGSYYRDMLRCRRATGRLHLSQLARMRGIPAERTPPPPPPESLRVPLPVIFGTPVPEAAHEHMVKRQERSRQWGEANHVLGLNARTSAVAPRQLLRLQPTTDKSDSTNAADTTSAGGKPGSVPKPHDALTSSSATPATGEGASDLASDPSTEAARSALWSSRRLVEAGFTALLRATDAKVVLDAHVRREKPSPQEVIRTYSDELERRLTALAEALGARGISLPSGSQSVEDREETASAMSLWLALPKGKKLLARSTYLLPPPVRCVVLLAALRHFPHLVASMEEGADVEAIDQQLTEVMCHWITGTTLLPGWMVEYAMQNRPVDVRGIPSGLDLATRWLGTVLEHQEPQILRALAQHPRGGRILQALVTRGDAEARRAGSHFMHFTRPFPPSPGPAPAEVQRWTALRSQLHERLHGSG